jgi:hypothetical protein
MRNVFGLVLATIVCLVLAQDVRAQTEEQEQAQYDATTSLLECIFMKAYMQNTAAAVAEPEAGYATYRDACVTLLATAAELAVGDASINESVTWKNSGYSLWGTGAVHEGAGDAHYNVAGIFWVPGSYPYSASRYVQATTEYEEAALYYFVAEDSFEGAVSEANSAYAYFYELFVILNF